ncbi:hypothetical protein QVD17_24728 [Tagetes erecta]|uniref:Uncharacterized protein n=1 Tax=Tagetes erecta TaxID=13708 RepID=A0AAD8NMW4_TARER|nr:hypothetical protein QVD17_24728 [Tagetes erecta]
MPKRKRGGLGYLGANDFEASTSSHQLLHRASVVRSSVLDQVAGVGVDVSVQAVIDGFSSASSVYLDLGSCNEIWLIAKVGRLLSLVCLIVLSC